MSQENSNTKNQKSEHLNYEERKIIERHLRQGSSKAEIARLLKRDKSTIKREIRRGTVMQRKKNPYESKKLDYHEYIEYPVYFADVGQRRYKENRQRCGAKNKVVVCAEMVNFVEERIMTSEKWSPDAAIGYALVNQLFEKTFTTKTFYNWIDEGLVKVKNIDLLLKVKRRPKKPRRERKRVLGKSIDDRPKEVETREEFGHWEGDGIVGRKQKGHLITLVERKLGIGLLFNVVEKTSNKIVEIIDQLEGRYGADFPRIFRTITFDNGIEFSASEEIEKGGRTNVFYAHPYSSWERPINENWNGMVRRFIPKGSSFESLTDTDISRINHYINTLPRKRLGYRTPLELWNKEISDILST